ncbi:TonB-dependent receptor [Variovorax dokdonensis]|uniref:TonB-dependent receptor n=2 Tax=Variovorax dokdonensis TaxID=344883 RepID=A0ABT7N8P2_9BURK|nr:TonB-dependent receptor [Variovorax dokdonensis]MDM0044240.1 TonB-dependent receptor [Variovorax dokdonensis]
MAAGAWAQSALPTTAPALQETVVTATRTPQRLADTLADVSVIDREAIERSGAQSVADVLARVQGIQISRNGGPGATTSVYVRGAETRFAAVYIDGVRVDSQSTGGAPWQAIALSQIDRIEVVRGPAAAVYGSDAIGGVIQLFTKKGEAGVAPYVGVGVGSHSLWRAETGVSGASGLFDYSLGVSSERSKGFNATTDAATFDTDRDGYETTSGNVRLGLQINPRQRIEGTLLANTMDSDYDNFGWDPANPVDDRNHQKLRTAGLNWSSQWTDHYRTKLSVTDSYSLYRSTPDFYQTETRLRGYLLQNELQFGPHRLTADLERREDELDNAPGIGPYAAPGLSGKRAQNGVALGYGFAQGPHTLQLNIREDDDSEFGNFTTGSAAYGFAITPAWRIRASAGTAFRAPTLYQRFSEYGVATLQPEESTNYEAGLTWRQDASSFGITAFHNRVTNLIGFDYSSSACQSFFGCYGNTARAQYEGVTLTATHRIGDVSLRGSFDWQNPRDLDTGNVLVQRARQYGTLGVDWRLGQWLLGAEVIASGSRYANAANTIELGGYGLLNLSVSRKLGRDLDLLLRLDNATDKDYQLVRNYATDGRTFYVGLKWSPTF